MTLTQRMYRNLQDYVRSLLYGSGLPPAESNRLTDDPDVMAYVAHTLYSFGAIDGDQWTYSPIGGIPHGISAHLKQFLLFRITKPAPKYGQLARDVVTRLCHNLGLTDPPKDFVEAAVTLVLYGKLLDENEARIGRGVLKSGAACFREALNHVAYAIREEAKCPQHSATTSSPRPMTPSTS